jgi:rubrerythrin
MTTVARQGAKGIGMKWTLEDIDWDRFDPSKVDPMVLSVVRAASMVEYRSADYVTYLCNIFADDEAFQEAARKWGEEENQHGRALGQWAKMADPSFDFDGAFADFRANYELALDTEESIRGTRAAELLARCMVEIGTSSFYSSIHDAVEEPVLKQICTLIARDEFSHYGLFRRHMERYLADEKLSIWTRIRIMIGRTLETGDDELAYAYHAANRLPGPYDRRAASDAYATRALSLYRPVHIRKGVTMAFKALGLSREGWWHDAIAKTIYRIMRWRSRKVTQIAA